MQRYTEVLSFWFDELQPAQHFKKDVQLDAGITRRFRALHRQASVGELQDWRKIPEGRLAEIIILDQFSRNIFRDDARAWAQDAQALTLATEMVDLGLDITLQPLRRVFVYLPYMHSEDLTMQRESVRLFSALGLESNLKYAHLHHDVIAEFGRFPHRNKVLGRDSSAAEIAYLEKHGGF